MSKCWVFLFLQPRWQGANLNNLSFNVNHGSTVSILGASGSGKSTLAALLAGLKQARSGEILIDGHTPELGVGEISLVFQGAPIFPALTVQENVAFGMISRGIEKIEAMAFAMKLLSSVGLGAKALAYSSQLSGGERQRVALLQALAFVPRLLILDEAFSALDCSTREQLQEDLSHSCTIRRHHAHDYSRYW